MATAPVRYIHSPGYLQVSQNLTGLTNSSVYEFRLLLRNDSVQPTVPRIYSGTATVTTS